MFTTRREKTERYEVRNLRQPVHWEVDVPGSKSITNRALLLSALGEGSVRLTGALFSDDTWFFIEALRNLGIFVEASEEKRQILVNGCAGLLPHAHGRINAGSSGTTARFLTAVLGVSDGSYEIAAAPQMEERPMQPLFETLCALGAQISWEGAEWHLPVRLIGAGAQPDWVKVQPEIAPEQERTERHPVLMELDIAESTQFLSAFLMAAPMFPDGARIRITSEKKDGPYIRMTRQLMDDFGVNVRLEDDTYLLPMDAKYRCETFPIEPDVSAACYFYAAAAVTGGYVRVNGIHNDSRQGDLAFLDVLSRMGCDVREESDGIAVTGPAAGTLHGVTVDMRDFSDQALTLAAIAPYADAPTVITNIAHTRQQESDRIHAIVSNLRRAGISCEESPDGVRIEPGRPEPCEIETFDDHRVAMAFAIMGLGAEGIVIENPACCRKTFKQFFKILDQLCSE